MSCDRPVFRAATPRDRAGLETVALTVRGIRWAPGEDHVELATAGGQVVGYGRVGERAARGDRAPSGTYVTGLAVLPQWRRRSVGTELLRRCLGHAPGTVWSFVNAQNHRSLALHAAAGFVEVERGSRFLGESFDGGDGVLLRRHPADGTG